MSAILAALRELAGLFVDDGIFALSLLGVIALTALAIPFSRGTHLFAGGVLIFGCLAVLAISVVRAGK